MLTCDLIHIHSLEVFWYLTYKPDEGWYQLQFLVTDICGTVVNKTHRSNDKQATFLRFSFYRHKWTQLCSDVPQSLYYSTWMWHTCIYSTSRRTMWYEHQNIIHKNKIKTSIVYLADKRQEKNYSSIKMECKNRLSHIVMKSWALVAEYAYQGLCVYIFR